MTRNEIKTYLSLKYGTMEEVFYRWAEMNNEGLTEEDEKLATEYYSYYYNKKLDKWD